MPNSPEIRMTLLRLLTEAGASGGADGTGLGNLAAAALLGQQTCAERAGGATPIGQPTYAERAFGLGGPSGWLQGAAVQRAVEEAMRRDFERQVVQAAGASLALPGSNWQRAMAVQAGGLGVLGPQMLNGKPFFPEALWNSGAGQSKGGEQTTAGKGGSGPTQVSVWVGVLWRGGVAPPVFFASFFVNCNI